jgi:gliding motility-associated-like protein
MNFKILQIILLLIFTFCCTSSKVQGQSVVGGEISYNYLSPNTYEIVLDVYTDCSEAALLSSQVINWNDFNCGVSASSLTVNIELGYPLDVSPYCTDSVSYCYGGRSLGVNHYRYSGILSLPSSCSNVLLSWTYQFRQNIVNTLTSPSNQGFCVEARFNGTIDNSAPSFLYEPLFFSCRDELINDTYKAVDIDGDSLVYSLVDCSQAPLTAVNYAIPYSGSNPINSAGPTLYIDNLTGAIEFKALTSHDASICVLVEEYRNGVSIGAQVRDAQLRIRGCSNALPTLSGINNSGSYQTTTTVNTPVNFFVIGNDLGNTSSNLNVTMIYDNTIPGATFGTTAASSFFGPDAVQGNFYWLPMPGDEGVHTFTVYVDDNNCTILADRVMTYRINVQPLAPNTVLASPDTSICVGDSVQLNVIGTGLPSSYQWTPSIGLSNPNIPNPKAAPTSTTMYNVVATYPSGASFSDQVTITVNTRPSVFISSQTNATCASFNDGSATAAIGSGTTGSYTYQWDANTGNQTTVTATSITSGAYQVVVEDLNGCTDSAIANIGANITAQASVDSIVNVLCHGDATGSIRINATGGIPPYNFLWNAATGNQTTATATNLSANINYRVRVTDASGCLNVLIDTMLTQPATPLSLNTMVTSDYNGSHVSCFGAADATITGFVSGGTGPYTYLWNTNKTTDTLRTPSGTYRLTVTDANSCTATDFARVANPPRLAANVINVVSSGCIGGMATAVGSGGTPGYTYSWNDGQIGVTAIGLQVVNNPYTVSIRDTNNCLATHTFSITPNSGLPPTPDIQALDASVCTGDSINLTTTTIGRFRYHWSGPGSFTSNLQSPTLLGVNPVNEGFYFLSIEDTLTNCFSIDTSIFISINAAPIPPFIVGGGIICDGTTIHIEDQVQTANCDLLWLGPAVAQTGTNFFVDVNQGEPNYQTGVWRLEYTDTITGCLAISNSVFINRVPNPPQPNPVVNGAVCIGGSANLSVPILLNATVNWYADPNRIGGVLYTGVNVTIPGITTDTTFYAEYVSPNCISSLGAVNIVVSPNPPVPTISPDLTICEGEDLLFGTTANADTFRWIHLGDTLANQQNFFITPSVLADAGFYYLSVIDANGCASPDTFVYVTINSKPIAPLAETNTPICDGEILQIYHSGACAQSIWLAPNGSIRPVTTDTLTLLSTDPDYERGNWRFICQDLLGCTDTSNFVNVRIRPSPPSAVSPFNNGPVCIGDNVRLGAPLVNGVTYTWYSDAQLTIPTIPGMGENPLVPNITTDSVFYVELSIGNCTTVEQTLVEVFPASPQPDIPADFSLCVGDTLLLTTPTNANSYQWILPSGRMVNNRTVQIQGVQLPNHNGLYTLSIRDLNDCLVPDTTVLVTVNSVPNPPTIFSEVICDNEPLVLIAFGACDSIEWTGPSGISFIGGDTIVILPGTLDHVDGGSWTALCINTATGCQSLLATHVVQIQPIPAKPVVNNNGPVCIGESVLLTTPIILGASYNWYTEDSSQLIGPGPIRTIANITSDTIFLLSIEINGCTNSDTTHVGIYGQPAKPILPDTIQVCEFDTLQLSTSTVQPTYHWTGPNGFNSTEQNPFVYPTTIADSGQYTLIVNDVNNCPSEADSVHVIVNRLPISPNITAKSTSVCNGDTIFLTSDQNCGTLIWEGPSGIEFLAGDSIFIDSFDVDYQNGNWTVLCIDAITGCKQLSNTLTTRIKPLPAQPILTNTSPICAGDSIDLSMSLVAGAFYQWFAFDSTLIDTFPNITIAGLETDTIFYGVIVVDGCGSFDTTHVHVNPRPATPTVSVADTVCSDLFIQFTISPSVSSGIIYNIVGPNGYTSSGPNLTPFISPIDINATGDYVIHATDINGCQSLDTTIFIQVNPTPSRPAITGTSIVCRGDSIRLETGACDSLVWTNLSFSHILYTGNNPSLVLGEGMQGYDPINQWGVRCFDVTTGCASQYSNGFRVEIKDPPSGINPSNNGPVCFNGNVTLSVTQQATASTYIWSTDSLLTDTIGTGTTIVVDSITTDTIFYIEVKDAYGCSTIDSTHVFLNPTLVAPDVSALNSVLCEREDIFLSELNYSTGHQWTGPNGFVSNSQFPIITTATVNHSGVYRVFAIDSNGCSSPVDSITIVVNALPTAPIISGGNNVCDGDSIFLNTNTICDSAVWVSPLGTLLGSGNVLGIGDLDATYGNTTWTLFCYDMVSGCFESSNVLGVNIVPSPPLPIISNNNPVCEGDSALLISSTVLGAVSTWYSDSLLINPIYTGDTLIIHDITNDSIVYYQQEVNGCFSSIIVDTIFYVPTPAIPNIGADAMYCEGDSIYLTTTTLASAYFWTDSSGFTSTQQNPIIPNATLADIGTYHLFLTDSNACAAPAVSMDIDVNIPPPIPFILGNDTTCNGDTLLFGTNRPLNVKIEWVTPNNDTFVTDSLVVITSDSIYYQFGQWTVIFTDTLTGCQSSMNAIFRIETIPTPGIIINSGPVCIGDSVILTSSQIAGVTDYLWFDGNASIVDIGQSITVPNIVGYTFFGLAVRTSLGCNYFMDSNFVSVHPPSPTPPIVVDTLNCIGNLLPFSTDPAAGYIWTGPNGVFSYQQNPIIGPVTTADAGFYTLSVVDTNGCNTIDTSIFVDIINPPSAPIASAPSLICDGDTLFLNSTAGSCDSAYWVGPGNRILSTANAIIPSDSSDYVAGNWQVFCVDIGSGCETASNVININIQTLAIPNVLNNGPVCYNDSAQLTANFVAGASYLWFSDSLRTDTIGFTQIINVDSLSTDSTFYVVLINSNGCASPLGETRVSVRALAPAPMIGADVQVCEGEDIQLLAGQVSLYGYNWTGSNGYSSNQENPIILNASQSDTGTYFLSVIDINGCISADTSLYVQVDSLPSTPTITNFVYLCANDTLYLNSASATTHCNAVQWIGPNGANYPVLGRDVAIAPGDTNHIGGLWQIQCIDTLTGCFTTSNTSLVIFSSNPTTQTTSNDGPICIGGTVNLSTAVLSGNTSYIWYADTSLTIVAGTGPNPAIQNITTDTTFYLVIGGSGGCTSDPIPTPVLTYLPVSTPFVSADTQYCVGDSIWLKTNTVASSYSWSGGNGFISNVQYHLLTASASVLDSGLYTLSVVDSNNCVSRDTSFRITINSLPLIPSLVSNSPICFGDTLQLSSSGQCGQSQWIGPLGNSASVLGTPGGTNILWTVGTSTSIPLADSSYGNASWYMICIDTVTGCRVTSNTINVTINPEPSISLVSNSGPICAGDSVDLSVIAFSSSGTTPLVIWYQDAALTQTLGIGATITVPNVSNTTSFYVEVIDPVTGCTTVDSTLVMVYQVSTAPTMPLNSTLCEGDLLSLSTNTIANGYHWTGPNGFVSNLQSPTPFVSTGLDSGTYYLSVIDSNNCPSLTGNVDIIINPVPTIPLVMNSGPGCTGDSIVLMASTVLGASYDWFKIPSGTSIGQGQNYTLTNVSLADTGSYYVVVTLNGCTTTSDSTVVTIFNNINVTAVVGDPQNLCGLDTTTITAGIPPNNITGFWTTNSSAIIVNPNNRTTLVANLAIGTNVFYWTLSNGTCPNISFDSLVVTVAPQSIDTAYAGLDQNLCGDSITSLLGNSPVLSTGTWTQSTAQIAAGVAINTSTNPSTNITGLVPGNTYTFVWEFENSVCGIHSTDTMNVTIAIAPSLLADAGDPIITCTQDTLSLNASNPSVGTGVWTTSSSAVIISPTEANTIVSNIQQDTSLFIWTLSNGSCSNYSSDTMFVILGGASPIANADNFNVIPSNTAILIDVLPNDLLTTSWDIYINTPMNSGQMLNLNNGEFELNLQGVTTNQSFIYELCNPVCPANCDTALVTLNISSIIECDIPNIFTPNEDGVNDLFEVPCLGNGQIAKLLVFNRWGDLVYQSDNYENQWNGTHQGKVLPDGTYFYIIKIGEEEPIQGSIELRR